MREGIGPDRIWLACQGHYTGPEIAFCDAGRLGADIVSVNKPPDWHNYTNQARLSLNQLFVNNIIWYNDPDTLMVTDANPLNHARIAAAVIALPGQLLFSGDKLSALSPARMRLLQQCLPVLDVYPRDLYPIYRMLPLWDLRIRRDFGAWDVLSAFNWEDAEQTLSVSFEELGLDGGAYVAYDVWNKTLIGDEKAFSVRLPGQSNALFALHPKRAHPQWLASDRHLSQGGVDITGVRWEATSKTLSGVVDLVAGFPTRLTFYTPQPFHLKEITLPEGVSFRQLAAATLLEIELHAPAGGPSPWRLQFSD